MGEAQDLSIFVRHPVDGIAAMDLVVDGVHCGACIATIEKGLKRAGVRGARVNLASKRVTVEWNDGALEPPAILERLETLGYPAHPLAAQGAGDEEELEKRLLRSLGVAAFASMNVMLLSISLWAGAENDPNPATRDLFHWLSALVALPCAAYAGMPFFESAGRALRAGSVNMDVPISVAVVLSLGMSLFQTIAHERTAYFESAVMLLTFLLAGRYLDRRMRRRTRDFATNLSAIRADRATKLFGDGEARETPIAAIQPGDLVLVRAGERIAVDGIVEDGRSEVDQSLVTGETRPAEIAPRAQVYAGALNLSGGLRVRVRNGATGTLLDEVNALLEKAVEQRSSYVRLADRAVRVYAPVVHLTALATFLGWLVLGAGWEHALIVAINPARRSRRDSRSKAWWFTRALSKAPSCRRIVFETGRMAPILFHGLSHLGLPVVCVESRQAYQALKSLATHKTDRNDARGLAHLARTGFFKPVHVKSLPAHAIRSLIFARKKLVGQRVTLENPIRGLAVVFGIRLPRALTAAFVNQALKASEGVAGLSAAMRGLIAARTAVMTAVAAIDADIRRMTRASASCRRLMTIPGVGQLTALAVLAAIDDPSRIRRSRDIGAYLGLVPRRYQSGEVDYVGGISKCGDRRVRTLLYEAADVVLTRYKGQLKLKDWAFAIAKRSTMRKARVALARRLAIIMHAMLRDGTEFAPA